MANKKILYDLEVDQRDYKWGALKTLESVPVSDMPEYLNRNYKKYIDWIEI